MKEKYEVAKRYVKLLSIMGYYLNYELADKECDAFKLSLSKQRGSFFCDLLFDKNYESVGTIKIFEDGFVKVYVGDDCGKDPKFIEIVANDNALTRPNLELVINDSSRNNLFKTIIRVAPDVMEIEIRNGCNIHTLFIDQSGENDIFAINNYMAINQAIQNIDSIDENDIETLDLLYKRIVAKLHQKQTEKEVEDKVEPLLYYDVVGFIYDSNRRNPNDINGFPSTFNHYPALTSNGMGSWDLKNFRKTETHQGYCNYQQICFQNYSKTADCVCGLQYHDDDLRYPVEIRSFKTRELSFQKVFGGTPIVEAAIKTFKNIFNDEIVLKNLIQEYISDKSFYSLFNSDVIDNIDIKQKAGAKVE